MKTKCSTCGIELDRRNARLRATCFDCKKKRAGERKVIKGVKRVAKAKSGVCKCYYYRGELVINPKCKQHGI